MEIRVFEWNDSSAEALLAQKEGFQKRFFCVRQIRRNKTRVEKKLKDSAFKDVAYEDVVPESDYEVIRHKKFVMHPMDVEEAILQMNLLGHTFFMFLNANTGETNVVYKRADGKYAVLEPVAE